jgi:glycosyltransferase involved in cell wall biosynthesis
VLGLKWFFKNVWPKILQRHPAAICHLAGRNFSQSRLNSSGKQVVIHGEVEDANQFIADKSILFVPLFSGSGIRIKIMEALAAGKAVVTTSIGAQGVDGAPGQHYLVADTADEFASAIVSVLKNATLRGMLLKNARELAIKNFSVNELPAKVNNVYQSVLKSVVS